MCLQIENPTTNNGPNYGDQSARNARRYESSTYGDANHSAGNQHYAKLRVRQPSDGRDQLPNRSMGSCMQPEQSGSFSRGDLDPNTCEESHEHSARKKVSKKSESYQSGNQEQHTSHKRDKPAQADPFGRVWRRQAHESPGQNRSRGGIGSYDQVSR
jgi:hypothetical protein